MNVLSEVKEQLELLLENVDQLELHKRALELDTQNEEDPYFDFALETHKKLIEMLTLLNENYEEIGLMNQLFGELKVGMSERGNTYLVGEDTGNQYFVARISFNKWLEVSIIPENYPAVNIKLSTAEPETTAKHIRDNHSGKVCRKCNIEDVPIVDGYVE